MVVPIPGFHVFFHASSGQVFGLPEVEPQDESTPFRPVNPYGATKALATNMVRIYRNAFGLFAVNGILFNHESPRRSPNFVTAKICRSRRQFHWVSSHELTLGDIEAERDWGHARDYVEGFWLALQHDKPADYVFATGELHSVKEIAALAFETVGLDPDKFLRTDASLLRPAEARRLVGNASKRGKSWAGIRESVLDN
jgi:GDPmannose 4,6-dehydratase